MKRRRVGRKYDSGKPRWDLLPLDVLEAIADVLTFGVEKYAEDNWQVVPNAEQRYFSAMMRHWRKFKAGELNDQNSGLPHIAHFGANALFLVWFGLRKKS